MAEAITLNTTYRQKMILGVVSKLGEVTRKSLENKSKIIM